MNDVWRGGSGHASPHLELSVSPRLTGLPADPQGRTVWKGLVSSLCWAADGALTQQFLPDRGRACSPNPAPGPLVMRSMATRDDPTQSRWLLNSGRSLCLADGYPPGGNAALGLAAQGDTHIHSQGKSEHCPPPGVAERQEQPCARGRTSVQRSHGNQTP